MERRPRSLSRSLFATLLVFTLAAVMVVAVALVTIAYHSEESRSEESLVAQARQCAKDLEGLSEGERIALLAEQIPGSVRFTLVDAEGAVAYDSRGEGGRDNHRSRPEVLKAEEGGEGMALRHSETLDRDTLYVAERLEGGWVVRLSEERMSLAAFLGSMALPLGVLLVLAAAMAVLVSRLLTMRIMRPLDNLDPGNPLAVDAYGEMQPLLGRIDQQQRLLKRQNEELKQAEGLRREFSANVSHEMKTPLQVISGSAEMIAEGLVAPQDTREFGRRIYSESQRLRALINDVLTLSRLDEASASAAQMAPVDLLEAVRRTCQHLEPLAAERDVSLSFGGTPAIVAGNDSLIEQALGNLVQNAIRYTGEGGEVAVDVSREEGPSGPQAVVRVRDTGIGIAAEDREKVFERFYRSEKSRSKETGGTGLGLAIVKHAALYHGGEVTVESEVGRGSEFTLRLPGGDGGGTCETPGAGVRS